MPMQMLMPMTMPSCRWRDFQMGRTTYFHDSADNIGGTNSFTRASSISGVSHFWQCNRSSLVTRGNSWTNFFTCSFLSSTFVRQLWTPKCLQVTYFFLISNQNFENRLGHAYGKSLFRLKVCLHYTYSLKFC